MDHDNCPVCWRPFSATTVPICLACGHSTCGDCLVSLRSCPLCRHKIAPSFPKKPNYSLLAMIERATAAIAHQTTQTDSVLSQITPTQPAVPARPRVQKPGLLEGKAIVMAIKRSSVELRFK